MYFWWNNKNIVDDQKKKHNRQYIKTIVTGTMVLSAIVKNYQYTSKMADNILFIMIQKQVNKFLASF